LLGQMLSKDKLKS